MAQASNLRICDVIKDLEKDRYLLPAIQREFVWKPEKICGLFDSLMRGYPIGTFLFWTISADHVADYRFYRFMRSYHERDNYRCEQLDNPPKEGFHAVLDGQQRMTALYIGLRGSYATKKPTDAGKMTIHFRKRDCTSIFFTNQKLLFQQKKQMKRASMLSNSKRKKMRSGAKPKANGGSSAGELLLRAGTSTTTSTTNSTTNSIQSTLVPATPTKSKRLERKPGEQRRRRCAVWTMWSTAPRS